MLLERFSQRQWVYLVTLGGSLIFSVVAILCEPYLNNDGIFYIDAANTYLREGVTRSLESYPWPFYSILIAVVHQITGLPVLISARLINVLIISSTCIVFVKLYEEITKHKGNLWIACFLILTLTGVNKYRDDVMRDFGFWLFALIGFLSFTYYVQGARTRNALVWQISMLIAFLFRVEAFALMVLGPFAVLFRRGDKKAVFEFFNLYSVYLLLIFLGGIWFFIKPDMPYFSSTKLTVMLSYGNLNGLVDKVSTGIRQMGDVFWYDGLNIEKNFWTLLITLLVAMVTYCVINIVACISIPFAILAAYGFFKKYIRLTDLNLIVIYFIIIQFVVLMVFLSQKFLLVPRYATVMVFLLLLLAGQIAERLIHELGRFKRAKLIGTIFLLVVIVQTGDTLITFGGYSKRHIVKAGLWAKDHIDSHQTLLSSDLKAVYYAGRHFLRKSEIPTARIFKRIQANQFPKGTHLIIDGKDEEREDLLRRLKYFETSGKIRIINRFANTENDWAVVVEVTGEGDGKGREE